MPKKSKKNTNKVGRRAFYLKSVSAGLIISIVLLFIGSFFNDAVLGGLLLYDARPYNIALNQGQGAAIWPQSQFAQVAQDVTVIIENPQAQNQATPNIVGMADVIIEQGGTTYFEDVQMVAKSRDINPINIDDLRNPERLRNSMYIVDPRTVFLPRMFDVDAFLAKDMRVNPQSIANGDPVVLIFHTHSTEFFVDSNPDNKFTGIVGAGAYLAELLNNAGIPTMHLTQRFDFIDGRSHILGAYERQEPYIRRILEMYPTIEVVIDLHRDGLPEGAPKLLTYIDGRPTAQLMFFNGLSLRNEGGVGVPITTLPNPYLQYNLAMSFQMQLMANELFGQYDLMRRIYLNAFRYSLHYRPKSLLVEAGAQNNYFHEIINAMYPLAEILQNVIK